MLVHRILVVEDHETVRRFVCSELQQRPEFCVVGEASNGEDAVQKAQELQPDLVLLDVGLPRLNGLEAARQISGLVPSAKILFLSLESSARVMQEATQSGGVRPYGVSLLIAGWDDGILPEAEGKEIEVDGEKKKISGKTGGILKGGPSLYQVDPSGSYFPWKATAIGKSATSAKTFLEKRYTEGLELEDAIHIALLTLKETIEGEMNGDTVEIGMFRRTHARLNNLY